MIVMQQYSHVFIFIPDVHFIVFRTWQIDPALCRKVCRRTFCLFNSGKTWWKKEKTQIQKSARTH